jgi:uncharacterized membrane protein YsdA (DUF1294 family)/cold shock CspA family protein
MPTKGKVISWDDSKGYGFISPIPKGKQIFIHIYAFSNSNRRPQVGDDIIYSVGSDKQGRPCVIKATLEGNKLQQNKNTTSNNNGVTAMIGATFFFVLVAVTILEYKISPIIFILYLVLSMITYSVYQNDKSAAAIGTWRTSENFLHLLALAGGWPGALVAQQRLRHKNKKKSFRFLFWVTVILNCSIYVWFLTTSGIKLFA